MKTWKSTKALVMMAALTTVVSACGGGGSTDGAKPTAAPVKEADASKEKVSFEWMAHTAYSAQGSDPKRVEYIKSSLDTYLKSHPNVDVTSRSYDGAVANLMILASQNRAPDTAMIDAYMLPKFYQYLQPLDSYFEKAGLKMDDFFPFAQNVMKGPDGKIYGIQFTTDTRVLYYRKDLVPTPPKTWNEVLETGKKLKEKGYDALLMPAGRAEASTISVFLPLLMSQGGELVNKDGQAAFGDGANRAKSLNVLNFLQSAVDTGVTPKRSSNIKNEADQNGDIATDKVAMFIGGNFQVNQLKDVLGPERFAKWGVAPMPTMNGENPVSMSGGWAWGIFTKDKAKQQAAFDFLMDTYIGDKGMTNWSNIGGYLPTRKSVYDKKEYTGNEFTTTFREIMEKNGKSRPASDDYAKISEQLQIAVSSVVSGSLTPEQALDNAWKTATQK
ncbi:multiple sugar transport system substrate-binding protein [Paenibacillus sp. 1_12]|uniref:extracellular solute-binding protein n=1 Tax=Paenibacillus sp. 1_12 TaxID=1566278 RepID=UPI0008E807E6|nr:extracellular solute-binding protein [Paenibacillus sp. 1_12]SFL75877.1 multiple sugar transport system substrate-binding protein [Paenibacillus sp. 1_12]